MNPPSPSLPPVRQLQATGERRAVVEESEKVQTQTSGPLASHRTGGRVDDTGLHLLARAAQLSQLRPSTLGSHLVSHSHQHCSSGEPEKTSLSESPELINPPDDSPPGLTTDEDESE